MENLLLQHINQISGSNPLPPMWVAHHSLKIELKARKQLFLLEVKFSCVTPNFVSLAETTHLNGRRMQLMGKTVVYDNKTVKTFFSQDEWK